MSAFEIEIGDGQSVAIARVMPDAHWQWLASGWVDFKATWRFGMLIGAIPVIAAWVMVIGLWRADMLAFIPAFCGGFALVGPILAIGCYDISARRAAGKPITLKAVLSPHIESPSQVAIIGFVLMLILMVWARLASFLFALAASVHQPAAHLDFVAFALQTPEGLAMIAIGTIIGGILATLGYLISVVSIPFAKDRKVDAITAMLTSAIAVSRSQGAMISFAFNIALLVAISLATGFVALIFIFPWLGHATWHCYRAVLGSAPVTTPQN